MKILFEDKNIIVLIKPSGVPSQPDKTGLSDLKTELTNMYNQEIFVVHRLDLQTSGIMVYAKNSESAGKLTQALQDGRKEYLAIIDGVPESNGILKDLLLHDKRINKSFVVSSKRAGVKEAILEYEVLDSTESQSLIKVHLITGRTHQIRAQFSSRGFPLSFDGKYGSRKKGTFILHCCSLSFIHPFTKKQMEFNDFPESILNRINDI